LVVVFLGTFWERLKVFGGLSIAQDGISIANKDQY
jgi:hypothetical protein